MVGRSARFFGVQVAGNFPEKTSEKGLTAGFGVVLLIVFPQKGSSLKVTLCD
jgi:hypothetical protein